MAADKALEVKATASVGGDKVHPTAIVISSAVNSMAQGRITYIHKSANAEQSSTDITAKDIFTAMAERQTKSFSDTPDTPGVDVTLTDAFNSSLNFKGNTSSPSYAFSTGDVMLDEAIQPDYSALNCLDLSMYNTSEYNGEIIKDESYPGNIAEFIKKEFENIIEVGVINMEGKDENQGKLTKECNKRQHEINEKVKKFAIQLFDNSKDTIGWDGVKDQLGPVGVDALRGRINNALKSNAGGFFNNILHLAEEFQCVYIPEYDNVGKLVNKKKLFESDESIELKSVSLSVSAGSVGMFPVRAVAVRSPGVPVANRDNIIDANDYGIIYPKDVQPGGSIMQILGPQWLPVENFELAEVKPVKDGSEEKKIQNNKLDPKSGQNAEIAANAIEKKSKESERVVEQWAETVYYWQALGQSYAIINTELMLNVKVGTRYTVLGKDGALFSGILNSVTHTIATSYESCTANSNMHFSHVIMDGATIPGIE